jgi:hypothetical protein
MLEMRKKGKKDVLSAGYPAVERLIDSEDFDKTNKTFEEAYVILDEINRKKRGLKKGRDAKKAMKAIEHVVDLFKELLEIKYRFQEMLDQTGKGKKKK